MQSVGLRVEVDGEAEYKRSLKEITAESKKLDSELKLVTQEFSKNADSQEALTAKAEVLKKQLANQQEYIGLLAEKLEKTREKYGENSEEASRVETALNKATTAQLKMQDALDACENPLEETAEGLEDVGESAGDASGKALTFGDVLKANIISDAIVGGVKALADGFKNVAKNVKEAFGDSVQWADDLATLSTQTGIATDTLQALEYMAGLADTPVSTVTGSLRKLTKSVDGASKGTGATAEAFERLGVSIKDDNGGLRDNYSIFLDVIDALGTVENATERDTLAMDIFGRSAQELNTLVAIGSEGMNGYADEAQQMGYILGADVIGNLTRVADSQDRLNNAVDLIKREGASALAPFVEALVNDGIPRLVEFADELNKLFTGEYDFGQFIEKVAQGITDHADDFGNVAESLINGLIAGFENAPNIIDAGAGVIRKMAEGMKEKAGENGQKLGEGVGATVTSLANNFAELAGPVAELAVEFTTAFCIAVAQNLPQIMFKTLAGVFTGAGGILNGLIKGIGADNNPAGEMLEEIASEYDVDVEQFRAIGLKGAENVANGVEAGTEAVRSETENMASAMEESVTEVTDQGDDWGADVATGIASGIRKNRWRIQREIDAITQDIYRPLHFSRPDEGPLRNYETWMPDMLKGMAKGLRDNSHLLEDAVYGVTGAIAGTVDGVSASARGINNVTVYTQQMTEAQVDYLINRVNSGMVGV